MDTKLNFLHKSIEMGNELCHLLAIVCKADSMTLDVLSPY